MKKKASILIIISIILTAIFTFRFSFDLAHEVELYNYYISFLYNTSSLITDSKLALTWSATCLFLSLCAIGLQIAVLFILLKSDVTQLNATIKAKIQSYREKRHQKKIEKAKALLESEDKRDE